MQPKYACFKHFFKYKCILSIYGKRKIETKLVTRLSIHPSIAKSYSLIAKAMGAPSAIERIVAECASPTLVENSFFKGS